MIALVSVAGAPAKLQLEAAVFRVLGILLRIFKALSAKEGIVWRAKLNDGFVIARIVGVGVGGDVRVGRIDVRLF